MPGLAAYRKDLPSPPCVPESVPLFLPSVIPASHQNTVCPSSLIELESELRYAQLCDSLEDLRAQLRLRGFTNKYKIKNVTGQRVNTSTQTLLNQISDKIRANADRYRRAWTAYESINGPGPWLHDFRLLKPQDVRGLNERALTEREGEERRFVETVARANDDNDAGTYDPVEGEDVSTGQVGGEGFRQLSWIWFAVGANVDLSDPTMHEGAPALIIVVFNTTKLNHSPLRRVVQVES